MFTKISAAAILVAIPAVRGLGQAVVENKCDFPVYLWSVSDSVGSMETLDSNSGNYSETYRTNADGGGISLKISRDQSQSEVTQFEYTLNNDLWYDISNINGYPFEKYGLTLIPTGANCPNVLCAAGVSQCHDAYNVPTDDHATSMCDIESDTVLVLCSGEAGADNADEGSSSTVAPAASPAPAPATSAAPVVAQAVPTTDPANGNVATTMATQWVTVSAPAATEAADDSSSPEWFGHHEAGWIPRAKRHAHHPRAAYA